MQNNICRRTSDPDGGLDLSQFLNILEAAGLQVVLGNLLTLPVGGGLLYVEPVYVQAKTAVGLSR